jgi:hypothetical protein
LTRAGSGQVFCFSVISAIDGIARAAIVPLAGAAIS